VCCYFHAFTPSDVCFLWLLLATERVLVPGPIPPTLINLGRLLIVSPIVVKSLIAEQQLASRMFQDLRSMPSLSASMSLVFTEGSEAAHPLGTKNFVKRTALVLR